MNRARLRLRPRPEALMDPAMWLGRPLPAASDAVPDEPQDGCRTIRSIVGMGHRDALEADPPSNRPTNDSGGIS